jgi:rod shape-determining protein MreD
MSYRTALARIAGLLSLFAVFILHYSFTPFLPGSLHLIQLPVVVIVGCYLLERPTAALYAALILGFLLDMASFQPFGIYTATLLACVAVVFMLLQTVFTNRSLYSFVAITAIVSIFFMIMFVGLGKAISFFVESTLFYNWVFYLRAGISTALLHVVIVVFLYYIVAAWRKRFL